MTELLNKIIDEKGISHAQFARDIDVTRSYAVAILSGKKPITETIFKNLIKTDYLIPYARKIAEYYFEEKFGKENYDNIKYFFSLAENFTFEADYTEIETDIDKYFRDQNLIPKESIAAAACSVLRESKDEDRQNYTNYPFAFEELDDKLYAYSLQNGNVINHLINFEDKLNRNAVLSYWKSLRWGFSGSVTEAFTGENQRSEFPYYFTNGKHTLLISFDCSAAIPISSESIGEYFLKKYENSSKTIIASLIFDESKLLVSDLLTGQSKMLSLDAVICPTNLFDFDTLFHTTNTEVPEDYRKILINAFLNYYNTAERFDVHETFIAYDAVLDWIQNGYLYLVSKKFLHEFTKEDRIKILNRLNEKPNFNLLKESAPKLPCGFILDSDDNYIYTNFLLTPVCDDKYEVFGCIPKEKLPGLAEFAENIFSYLSFELFTYSDDDRKALVSQLAGLITEEN